MKSALSISSSKEMGDHIHEATKKSSTSTNAQSLHDYHQVDKKTTNQKAGKFLHKLFLVGHSHGDFPAFLWWIKHDNLFSFAVYRCRDT